MKSDLLWAAWRCWYQGHWVWWRAGCPSFDPPLWSGECSWHKRFHVWHSCPPAGRCGSQFIYIFLFQSELNPNRLFLDDSPDSAWPKIIAWQPLASRWCWQSSSSFSGRCQVNQICHTPAPSCLTGGWGEINLVPSFILKEIILTAALAMM